MSERRRGVEHERMTLPSSLLRTDPALRRAPMPLDVPPVGPVRARRIRLLRLREELLGRDAEVDVDALAERIVHRVRFTRELRDRLTAQA
ncbi:MAG: hypothetical protein QOE65_2485 [Solirubrobacteraceae bacterium]|jgi:hypothetical protein|nr:hypothetical protein [Solirubrobacteraceae bacterium]